ncbi:MAG: type IV pilin protein [Planctomycetota bacterium]
MYLLSRSIRLHGMGLYLALLLLPAMASLRAEEPAPDGGPTQVAKADFTPVAEVRMTQVATSMADLKHLFDVALPYGSLQALYLTKIYFVHSTALKGIDPHGTLHLIAFAPKALFTATRETFQPLAAQSAVAQLIPVSDEKAFLAQMKLDSDRVQAEGDFQVVQFKDLPLPMLYALNKGYAVFSPTPMGLQLGLGQIDAVAAADAASKADPAIEFEIKPRALMAAGGFANGAGRQAAVAIMTAVTTQVLRGVSQRLGLPGMVQMAVMPMTVQPMIEKILASGDQCDSLELYAKLEPSACSLGVQVEAAEGSDLAKAIAAMPPLDPQSLRGLHGATSFFETAGTTDPSAAAALASLADRLPPESLKYFPYLKSILHGLSGHPVACALGVDDTQHLALALELDSAADLDQTQVVTALKTMLDQAAAQLKTGTGVYWDTTQRDGEDQGGWKSTYLSLAFNVNSPWMAEVLHSPNFPASNPFVFCVLRKAGRLVIGTGADEVSAAQMALEYADKKDNTRLDPDFAARIASNCKNRSATAVSLFRLYPVIDMIVEKAPVPPFVRTLVHAMKSLNPIMATDFAHGRIYQSELLLENDNLKQFAFTPIVAAIAIPNLLASKLATNETAVVQNLKALATAQMQYNKMNDTFASNAADLNANGTLIAADLKMAFEVFQKNGDEETPTPKAGYVFRMLQGRSSDKPTSLYVKPGDPTGGMNSYGVIARAVEPGTTGEHQYFIAEWGTVYEHDEPSSNDPNYKKFLLDCVPPGPDSAEMRKLEELGWRPAGEGEFEEQPDEAFPGPDGGGGILGGAPAVGPGGAPLTANQVAAVQNLKALATAQAQYNKKTDYYSNSGMLLNTTSTLIAADFADAFEGYLSNGDKAKPVAYHGYVYRMLQGDDPATPNNFLKDPDHPDQGMNTWACVARPVDGKGPQFFISEQGTVYERADPGDGTFLLKASIPNSQLAAITTWTTVR